MKFVLIIVSIFFCSHTTVLACSILNSEETEIGNTRAIKGICSTDRKPITCEFQGGEGTTCDGPAGSYTGFDLNGLISSACGCNIYQFEDQEWGQEQKDEYRADRSKGSP